MLTVNHKQSGAACKGIKKPSGKDGDDKEHADRNVAGKLAGLAGAVPTAPVPELPSYSAEQSHSMAKAWRYAVAASVPLVPTPAHWRDVSAAANVLGLALNVVGLIVTFTFAIGIASIFRKP